MPDTLANMESDPLTFRICFEKPQEEIELKTSHGDIEVLERTEDTFTARLSHARLDPGPPATIIQLMGSNTFSFFARDIRPGKPLWYPECGVAITAIEDTATYAEIAKHPAMEAPPPESSLEEAMAASSGPIVPLWLALGGDARTLLVSFAEDHGCWGWITPWQFHHRIEKENGYQVEWDFTVGRGSHYRHQISRRLEDGALPILHSTQTEEGLEYRITLFATTASGDLSKNPPRGTDWRAAYMSTMGCMFTEEQKSELADLYKSEVSHRTDCPVCILRVEVCNKGESSAYAFYRMPSYKSNTLPPMYPPLVEQNKQLELDPDTGLCHEGNSIFSFNFIDGKPLPNEEMAVLLDPDACVTFECRIPFQPLPPNRADSMQNLPYQTLFEDCRQYWQERLHTYPGWHLPEPALEERLRAGNLHIAINTLGERLNADTPLLATVGVYAPIGTESSAILWHLDAMGHHETARRCLDYFYEIQREDGYIQSFNFYDAETGPVLGNTWRHYLVTGNLDWLRLRQDAIARACRYLIERRKRTMEADGPDHPAYGMLSGKIADPDEFFHQFSLNAEAAEGLRGGASILRILDHPDADWVDREAEALAEATCRGFQNALSAAPLVPGPGGVWAPLVGGWPGTQGEVSLYAKRGRWFTHGSFHARAQAFLKLVRSQLIRADDPRIAALVRSLESTVLRDYTGPSQPYNQRSDYFYAATGQVGKFTQLFYRQLTRLQDRETYTFWEHYYKLSSQKINEEAWFLQQLTWMLCFEEGCGLTLLKMAPTAWFSPGKKIDVESIHTPFGRIAFTVHIEREKIHINITREPGPVRNPARMGVRLPRSLFAEADTGLWNPQSEILELNPEPEIFAIRVMTSPR